MSMPGKQEGRGKREQEGKSDGQWHYDCSADSSEHAPYSERQG